MKDKEIKYVNEALETDRSRVMGIGTAEIKGYSVVKISIDYLERAIKMLKLLHKGELNPSVDIAVADDLPLIIGEYCKETSSIAGIAIAPKIESKD